jgi:hypothetical protein
MLLHSLLLANSMAAATLADILVVPSHVRYSGPINNLGSISPDNEIIDELDYQRAFTHTFGRSGVSLLCSQCPFAVNSSNSQGYTFLSGYANNRISVTFDTANEQLNLNGNPFLNS